ncbi:uncharacterized protein V1516DRAFT_684043 [Lipomyces oligophaga]|uniref:uncharacterized protein n=1 Tax=Lipomyces oligophaga TaxID=45792 RepID=UPI0034CFEBC1
MGISVKVEASENFSLDPFQGLGDVAKDHDLSLFGNDDLIFDLPTIVPVDSSAAADQSAARHMSSVSMADDIFSGTPALDHSPFDSPPSSDSSPLFGLSHLDSSASSEWTPLFTPAYTNSAAPSADSEFADRTVSPSEFAVSASLAPADSSRSPRLFPSLSSADLSSSASEVAPTVSRSSSSEGVILSSDGAVVGISERKRKRVCSQSYTRRPRADPLPPIVVDDSGDSVAVKRARNTLAARRSRERKMLLMDDLTKQVDQLTAERDNALLEVEKLKAEVMRLRGL